MGTAAFAYIGYGLATLGPGLHNEADEAEGLNHAGADNHVGEETASNLGLTGGRFLCLADHEANTEAGAQGGGPRRRRASEGRSGCRGAQARGDHS